MYCLSQFCCLCFRNKVKLNFLHNVTCGDAAFLKTANVVIPEIQLSELSHVLSVCEDCVNFVAEMHTFRRSCVHNHFLLVEYIELLGSFGGEIGDSQIRISDLGKVRRNVQNVEKVDVANFEESGIKLERREGEDPGHDLTYFHCNETPINDKEATEEEVEYKIEVHDDFNDKYGKEEINDDPHEDLFLDPVHSPELQTEDTSSSDFYFMKYCEENTFYRCKICKTSLKSKKTFRSHILIHNGKRRIYKCETCSKTYFRLSNLKIHNLTHTNEKPHECKTCRKCFFTLGSLKKHTFLHSGEKPHECETCGKRFAFAKSLRNHAFVHSAEKPHKCKTCGKCFTTLDILKYHLLVHSDEKPHKCETCGKRFNFPDRLKKHTMTHTGDKPYKCDLCGKTFFGLTDLNRHFVIHSGEKAHRCDVCGKSFALKHYLSRHMSVHSEFKLYKCDLCEKSYFRAEYLTRHKSKHHP